MSEEKKLTPDEAYKNMLQNMSGALGELMKITYLLDKRELEIRISEVKAALLNQELAVAVPLRVLCELTCLVPVLLYIFEEAPELLGQMDAPKVMVEAIARCKYRPDVQTREALSRLFKQVAGVEA